MEPRMTVITLGVSDVNKSRKFYEKLGFEASKASQDDVVFFPMNGSVLALYPRKLLAEDANVKDDGAGFDGVTIAQNVRSKSEVNEVLEQAEKAGAEVTKSAQDVFWGGYHGYFKDPDGHMWEIAWNPGFELDDKGRVRLP